MKSILFLLVLPLCLSAQRDTRYFASINPGISWYGDATDYARFSPGGTIGIEDCVNGWACLVWSVGYRMRGNTAKGGEIRQHVVPVSLGFDFGPERGLLIGAHFFTGIQAGTYIYSKVGGELERIDRFGTDRLNPEVGARFSVGWRLPALDLRVDFEQAAFDIFPTLPGTTRPAALYVGVVAGW